MPQTGERGTFIGHVVGLMPIFIGFLFIGLVIHSQANGRVGLFLYRNKKRNLWIFRLPMAMMLFLEVDRLTPLISKFWGGKQYQ